MPLMLLRINSQLGRIALQIQNARLEGAPEKLEHKMQGNAGAQIELKTTLPHVEIDQTESFASAGLKRPLRQIREEAQKGMQDGLRFIGRIAADGIRMMEIEKGGNPIADLAREKQWQGTKRVTIRAVTPPTTTAVMGTVETRDVSRPVQSYTRTIAKTTQYTPSSFGLSWGVHPHMDIWVEPGVELHFPDAYAGRNVNQAI